MLQFWDRLEVTDVKSVSGGYLVTDARVARSGIQLYRGAEVGKPDMAMVRVYRPEEEVFTADAMRSFAHKPVTNDHPPVMVDSENWREHAVGFASGDIARDGDTLRIPLMLADAAAVADVQAGKRELSAGYTCDLDFTPGTSPDGSAYDARQVHIRANHIAIVERGRAGAQCRIGDASPPTTTHTNNHGGRDMPENLRTVLVDGFSIQTNDQGEQWIRRLEQQLTDAKAALTGKAGEVDGLRATMDQKVQGLEGQIAALTSQHRTAIEAKDGEIAALNGAHTAAVAAKDGEIAAERAKVPDVAALDALLEARLATISNARRFLGDAFDFRGKSDLDIQRAVVGTALKDAQIGEREPAYVQAAFDVVMRTSAPMHDGVRNAMRNGLVPAVGLMQAPQASRPMPSAPGGLIPVFAGDAAAVHPKQAHIAHLQNAWKGDAA